MNFLSEVIFLYFKYSLHFYFTTHSFIVLTYLILAYGRAVVLSKVLFYRIVLKQEWRQASSLPIYSLFSSHTNHKYRLSRLIVLAEHPILWIQILTYYTDNSYSLIVSFSTSYAWQERSWTILHLTFNRIHLII